MRCEHFAPMLPTSHLPPGSPQDLGLLLAFQRLRHIQTLVSYSLGFSKSVVSGRNVSLVCCRRRSSANPLSRLWVHCSFVKSAAKARNSRHCISELSFNGPERIRVSLLEGSRI